MSMWALWVLILLEAFILYGRCRWTTAIIKVKSVVCLALLLLWACAMASGTHWTSYCCLLLFGQLVVERPRMGLGQPPHTHSLPNFPHLLLYLLLFTFSLSYSLYLFCYFSIPSLSTRIGTLCFQARGRRRRPNLGLVFFVLKVG